jgi:hypothetical protein
MLARAPVLPALTALRHNCETDGPPPTAHCRRQVQNELGKLVHIALGVFKNQQPYRAPTT